MNHVTDKTHDTNQGNSTGTYTINQLAELLNCSVRHARRLDAERSVPGRLTFGRLAFTINGEPPAIRWG
jgi:MarR-like DNA-binding transcriptional regulator SgrR of sgrS sRNA